MDKNSTTPRLKKGFSSLMRPWFVWAIAAFFGLYQFLLQGSPSVMIPGLMKDFSIDVVQIGFLTSAFFYTYLLMQVPTGMLIDRFGPKKLLVLGALLCTVACVFFALSQTLLQAKLARMLMGFTSAPAILTTLCLGARWFPPHMFVMIVGLTETFALFGAGVGEVSLAQTVTWFGWRNAMIICASFSLLLAIVASIVVKDHPVAFRDQQPRMYISMNWRETYQNFMHIMRVPQVWINGIFAGFLFAIIPAFGSLWSIPFFIQRYSLSLVQSANLTALFFIGAGLGAPILGWLSEKMQKRRPLMLIGNIVALLTSCIIIYLPIPIILTGCLLPILGFSCAVYALPYTIIGEILPQKVKGMAMGITNLLAISIGAPIIQPLVGWLLVKFTQNEDPLTTPAYSDHDYMIALSLFPLALLIALPLCLFVKETYCKIKNVSRIKDE